VNLSLPGDWQVEQFASVIFDVTGGNPKVQVRDYLPKGALPVIDQGEEYIGGYTENLSAECRVSRPCILFGDHTRIFKWIDQPFALGADGVKVLTTRDDLLPRFAYHYLRTLRLPDNLGYSRHFKYLKESRIPVPPRPTQQRIADILDKADAIRRKQATTPELTRALVLARFREQFGTLNGNTMGWTTKPLEELVDSDRPITYGILKPGPDVPEGIRYVRVVDIQNDRILCHQLRRTSSAIAEEYRRSRIRAGDILLSIRGHVGRLAIVPAELDGANITQDTARISLRDQRYRSFVFWFLDAPETQRWMERHVKGVAVQGINLGDIRRIPVPLPTIQLVQQFDRFQIMAWQLRLNQEARAHYANNLFHSLVQRAFRGEL
jgi:type I restriction enzyme S subunit